MALTESHQQRFDKYRQIRTEAEQWMTRDGQKLSFDEPFEVEAIGPRELVLRLIRIQGDLKINDEKAIEMMDEIRQELFGALHG